MSQRRHNNNMQNFDSSFSRRPANNAGQNMNISSLLGEPPSKQNGNQNYSKNPFGNNSGGGGGGNYNNDNFARRGGNQQDNIFASGGGGQSFGGGDRMRDNFDNRGSGGGDFNRFDQQGGGGGGGGGGNNQRDSFGSGWGQRDPSPQRFNRGGGSPPVPRDRNPAWSNDQGPGNNFDAKQQHLLAQQNLFNAQISGLRGANPPNNAMQGLNMGQMGNMGQDNHGGAPPVVMVMPQGQGAAGGMMGMMQASQNPFNVLAGQQRQMQVLVGNLPAFNPDAFGQQIMQGVGGAFGQGIVPQNMGMNMAQQQQQQQQPSQQFNRFNDNSGRNNNQNNDRSRSSRNQNRSSSNNMGNNNNNRSSSGRRSDSNVNNRNSSGGRAGGGGGAGNTNTTPSRTQRKRGGAVLRDPYPEDNKRAKPSGGQPNNKGNNNNRNRASNNRNAGNKQGNKAGGNKNANKANDKKKSEDAEKKEDKKDDKAETKTADDDEAKVKEEKSENDPEKAEGDETEDGKDKVKEKKVSKYDEFPASLLVCKICQKVMNDGSSFESHLNGRAHLSLVKILEQRFQKRTELLMHESKLAEDEIGVEMERQRRAGKQNHGGKNSKMYCKMCDCNYMVNWGTHKVSLGHRILKEFLHPTCRICNAHFVHRADWVAHLITLSHLRKLVELKNEGADVEIHESPTQDELFSISIESSGDDHITNAITIRSLDSKPPIKEDMKEMLQGEKGELVVPEGEVVIPAAYDAEVAVGEDAIMTVSGSCCKVCRQYIANEEDVQPHLKSKTHFNIYVAYLKGVVQLREEKAEEERKAAEEAEKKAKREIEEEEKRVAAEAAKVAAKAEADKKAAEVKTEDAGKSEDKKETVEDNKDGADEETAEEDAGEEEAEQNNVAADESMDVSNAAEDEEEEEFVVEEEIKGDDDEPMTEENKDAAAPAEPTPAKSEEKPAEVKVEEKKAEEKKPEEKKPEDKKSEGQDTPKQPERNQSARRTPRGRGPRGGNTPAGRGRGAQQTPNVNKNVPPRVDSNLRGGRGQNAGGRGSPRGGNNQRGGGGGGGGGNWRGNNRGRSPARGGGRPFQR